VDIFILLYRKTDNFMDGEILNIIDLVLEVI